MTIYHIFAFIFKADHLLNSGQAKLCKILLLIQYAGYIKELDKIGGEFGPTMFFILPSNFLAANSDGYFRLLTLHQT